MNSPYYRHIHAIYQFSVFLRQLMCIFVCEIALLSPNHPIIATYLREVDVPAPVLEHPDDPRGVGSDVLDGVTIRRVHVSVDRDVLCEMVNAKNE